MVVLSKLQQQQQQFRSSVCERHAARSCSSSARGCTSRSKLQQFSSLPYSPQSSISLVQQHLEMVSTPLANQNIELLLRSVLTLHPQALLSALLSPLLFGKQLARTVTVWNDLRPTAQRPRTVRGRTHWGQAIQQQGVMPHG